MNDATELTIRDVLQQMDRRLTIVEEGLKALRLELRAEITALRSEMTSGFRWIVGLVMVQWLSMMGVMVAIMMRQ